MIGSLRMVFYLHVLYRNMTKIALSRLRAYEHRSVLYSYLPLIGRIRFHLPCIRGVAWADIHREGEGHWCYLDETLENEFSLSMREHHRSILNIYFFKAHRINILYFSLPPLPLLSIPIILVLSALWWGVCHPCPSPCRYASPVNYNATNSPHPTPSCPQLI